MFYQPVVASVFFFMTICWGRCIRARNTKTLNKIIRKSGSLLGTTLEPLELTVDKKIVQELHTVLAKHSHNTTYFELFQLEAHLTLL